MQILHQIGTLCLGSIPTMILFLILVFCYRVLMDSPLRRILAERREQTAGARERAEAAIADAEAKTRAYGDQLRAARFEITQGREKQIAEWNAAREKATAEAREAANARVRDARKTVEAEAERSRAALDPAVDELAGQILKAVLPPAARRQQGARA